MNWQNAFIALLKKEFERLRSRNPRYSLRQWSEKLGISSGALSEILAGRRKVTPQKALAIARAAKISDADTKRILALMGTPLDVVRVAPKKEDVMLIHDWINHAICGFYELRSLKIDSELIAQRIGIPKQEVESRTRHLIQRGLLQQDKNGNVFRVKENWDVALTLNASELHELKKKVFEFVGLSLDKVPRKNSYFFNYSFPGNPDQIQYVKNEIQKIINTLDAMSENEESSELIHFSLQIFPVNFSAEDKDS